MELKVFGDFFHSHSLLDLAYTTHRYSHQPTPLLSYQAHNMLKADSTGVTPELE
jgi:hypothetical protein